MVPDIAPISAWLLLIFSIIFLTHQCVTRRMELIGFPIIFMAGMVQFYFLTICMLQFFEIANIPFRPQGEGFYTLAWLMPLFTFIYLYCVKKAQQGSWGEWWFPAGDYPRSYVGICIAFGAMASITAATFLLPGTGYQDQLLFQLRPTFASAMIGFATALIAASIVNPIGWILLIASFPFALIISTTQSAGRVPALSVMLVIPWTFYYLRLRYRSVAQNVAVLGVLGFFSLSFLFVYSNIRHEYAGAQATFEARQQQLSALLETGNEVFMAENLKAVFLQDAPLVTALCIEVYPRDRPLIPFQGLSYYLASPMPRAIWEDKPVSMGVQIQQLLHLNANLGIGIIGHGWVEGMTIGVIGYAAFFGLLVGWFDRLVRKRATNPYFVVVMGSTCGQLLCIPRGETFQLLALMTSGWFACWVLLYMSNAVLGTFSRGFSPIDFGPPADRTDIPEEQREYGDADFDDLEESLPGALPTAHPGPA